jgi:hypothetical protein
MAPVSLTASAPAGACAAARAVGLPPHARARAKSKQTRAGTKGGTRGSSRRMRRHRRRLSPRETHVAARSGGTAAHRVGAALGATRLHARTSVRCPFLAFVVRAAASPASHTPALPRLSDARCASSSAVVPPARFSRVAAAVCALPAFRSGRCRRRRRAAPREPRRAVRGRRRRQGGAASGQRLLAGRRRGAPLPARAPSPACAAAHTRTCARATHRPALTHAAPASPRPPARQRRRLRPCRGKGRPFA